MLFSFFSCNTLQFKFAVELIPVIVVGAHTCLMHLADGGAALKSCWRFCRIIILSLAPSTTFSHFAVNTFLITLSTSVEGKERTQFVFVDAVVHIANNPCLLIAKRILCKSGAWIEITSSIHGKHTPSSTPVVVLQLFIHWFSQMFAKERACVIGFLTEKANFLVFFLRKITILWGWVFLAMARCQ